MAFEVAVTAWDPGLRVELHGGFVVNTDRSSQRTSGYQLMFLGTRPSIRRRCSTSQRVGELWSL